jgi:hypothetical protein
MKITIADVQDTTGYNKVYRHQWRTSMNALPMQWINQIDNMTTGRWGWHFIPHKNMDYRRNDWHEDQTLFLTFELQDDLVQVMLSLGN